MEVVAAPLGRMGRSLKRTYHTREASRSRSRFSKRRKSSIGRLLSNPTAIYQFKRTGAFSAKLLNSNYGFTVGGTRAHGLSIMFALNGSVISNGTTETIAIPNYAEFTALFDQFRIDRIKLRLVFSNNTSTTASTGTNMPSILVTEDWDDATVPTSTNELMQRPEHKFHNFGNAKTGNVFEMWIKPRVAVAAYQASAFSAFTTPEKGTWVNCAYPATQHYGVKIYHDATNNSDVDIGIMQIYCEYYLSFRGVQ